MKQIWHIDVSPSQYNNKNKAMGKIGKNMRISYICNISYINGNAVCI